MVFNYLELKDLDRVVKEICDNELGFLLVRIDDNMMQHNLFSLLSEHCSCEEIQGMFGNGTHISFKLFHIAYNEGKNRDSNAWDAKIRNSAVYGLFSRWTLKGYNSHNAKNPYNCRKFMNYIQDIGFLESDYLLLKAINGGNI